jgi:plastocyanin
MNTIKTSSNRLTYATVSAMILANALTSFAATTNVLVGTSANLDIFTPAVVNINAGDQIIWTWQGTRQHSTTSGTVSGATTNYTGLWGSGVSTAPNSFTNSFPSAGSFPFYCQIHYAFGMTGVVNVATAPIVLSAPQFFPPAHFQFDYDASSNQNYIVQRSTDLTGTNWTTLGTNQATDSPVIFDDTNATANPAFYRVGLLPGP